MEHENTIRIPLKIVLKNKGLALPTLLTLLSLPCLVIRKNHKPPGMMYPMTHLEVKRTADGRTLARRRDGKPLTAGDRVAARRMIETKAPNGLSLGDVVYEFFADEPPGWQYLVIKRPKTLPQGPITVDPGVRIEDISKFIERTIQDLVTYVADKNRGSYHWVDRVLDEKLEHLELCGITAEIRVIQ